MNGPVPKVWGTTQLIFDRGGVEMHRIVGLAGGYCSKHKHHYKYNLFYVERGRLRVVVFADGDLIDEERILSAGESMVIRPGQFHRFWIQEHETVAYELYYLDGCPHDIIREDVGGRMGYDPTKDTDPP